MSSADFLTHPSDGPPQGPAGPVAVDNPRANGPDDNPRLKARGPLPDGSRLTGLLANHATSPKPWGSWGVSAFDGMPPIRSGDGASLWPIGATTPRSEAIGADLSTDETAAPTKTNLTGPPGATPDGLAPGGVVAAPKTAPGVACVRGEGGSSPEGDGVVAMIEGRVAAHLEAKDRDGFLGDEDLHRALAGLQRDQPSGFIPVRDRLHKLVAKRDLQDLLTPHRNRLRDDRAGARRPEPTPPEDGGRGILYPEVGGWTAIERINPRTGAPQHTDLAPFVARVAEKEVRDDGLEPAIRFRVVGTRHDGAPLTALDLSAAEFTAMDWPLNRWGLHLEALPDAKNHLKAAILKGSDGYPTRTVYTHTGWREVDGRWLYLHAGGAIGAGGADPHVRVSLPDRLALFELPEPPAGGPLREAVRAVLGLMDLASPTRPGSEALAAVVLALPFRAVLGSTLFSVWVEGLSGAFKTELAANVLQRFFGPGFHREAAPGSWSSTDNALEIQAYAAKDALFLIDDFRPPEGPDRPRYVAKASRLLRNAVDRRGRDRARVDGSLQPSKYPRGTLLVTAESGPPAGDQAAIGRTLILKVAADRPEAGLVGTLDRGTLRRCADDARAGLYARALAGFLRWVAPRYEEIRSGLRDRVDERTRLLRAELDAAGLHHRTPEIVADLLVGLDEFIHFAVAVGAVDFLEATRIRDRARAGLVLAGSDQREHHQESDPVAQFFAQLAAALASGQAHLADRQGRPPAGIEAACGWREDGPGQWRQTARWKAGWVAGEEVYLSLESAYAAAASVGPLAFEPKTLSRRLKDKGLLRHTEGVGGNTVKRTCEKVSYRVLVLALTTVVPTAEEPAGSEAVIDGEELPF